MPEALELFRVPRRICHLAPLRIWMKKNEPKWALHRTVISAGHTQSDSGGGPRFRCGSFGHTQRHRGMRCAAVHVSATVGRVGRCLQRLVVKGPFGLL